jgi:PleD family two-component response regulator
MFSETVNTPENIIAAADRALYQAKNMGKDRVVFYGDDNPSDSGEHE